MAKTKTKRWTERYYELTEDQMQTLLQKAKANDQAAQLELLEIFSNFLMKYETLLFEGRYSLNDYDIRCFIALFVKDKIIRSAVKRNKITPAIIRDVNEVMRGIFWMVQRYGNREDVEQTVRMAFLACVNIYERKGKVPFSGFLYSYYYYVLKKEVDRHLINQLGRRTFLLMDDEAALEEPSEDMVGIQSFTAPPSPAADELIFADEIDEDWVAGKTCHGVFAQLTVQERQLLKWKYVDGMKANEIAAKISEHPNTSRESFHRLRKRIMEHVEEENKLLASLDDPML